MPRCGGRREGQARFATLRGLCLFVLVLLAACGENVTGVQTERAPGVRSELRMGQQSQPRRATPYACFVSVREPSGQNYRYFNVPLHFARGLQRAGGSVRYRYRGYERGTELAVVANCIIPPDGRAADQLTRRLRNGAEPQTSGTQEDGVTIQGCVTEDDCMLPGLVIKACQYGGTYPNCRQPFASEIPPCMDGGGCGGGEPIPRGGSGDPDPCLDCFPPEDEDPPCATGDSLVDSPAIQDAFHMLWEASDPDTVMEHRRELGGWIVKSSSGYELRPFPSEWTVNACGIDAPAWLAPPRGTIAWVHTHPYRNGDRLTSCESDVVTFQGMQLVATTRYENDPSSADGAASLRWGMPGVVIDHDKITRFKGNQQVSHLYEITNRYGRCGY